MRKLISMFVLMGVGSILTYVPWSSVSVPVKSWFNEPSVSEFGNFFVSDMGTAYSEDDFQDIGGIVGTNGEILGSPICPKTGAIQFRRLVGRVHTDFFGNVIKFEPAEEYKTRARIEAAKGDMNWNQFFDAAEKMKSEQEAESNM